uniref:Major facilitator superfamily (MFS) profile domain-containing protein n=1 Tax=Graphocephala atropunctata TaxID=36148 RepID=A0A1B6MC42_9HEMI
MEPARLVPPDGGTRAWLVMIASFFCNGVIFGVINCYSVIYVELQERLDQDGVSESSSKAALVGSLTIGTTFFLSPIAGILTDKIGIRLTTFIGGLMATGGMFLSSFCTNSVLLLYLTYGVLFGVGASLAYTPSLVILGHYFHRYMGLVNGFVTAGSSIFTMIMPYLIDLLLKQFGLNVCLRVLAVFMCLIMASALLFKPLPLSGPEVEKKEFKSLVNTEIWHQKKYVIWALAIPVALFGYFVPYVHMIKFVAGKFPEGDGKSLVFCIGVASGTGRLVFGRIADNQRVNRVLLQQLSFLFIGLLTMLMTVSPSFRLLQLIALAMGLFDGCFISLLGPIAFDLCGQEGAGQAIGFLLGFCSIPLTIGPPIAGLIYDHTKSYTMPFLLAGVPPIVCAAVLCLVHYVPNQRLNKDSDTENRNGEAVKTEEVPESSEFNALLHINSSDKEISR